MLAPIRAATVAVLLASPAAAATTLTPEADARVVGGSFSSTNYVTGVLLAKREGTGNRARRAYLRFDLGTVSTTITDATLTLTAFISGALRPASGQVVQLSALDDSFGDDWDESLITWNNQPGGTGVTTSGRTTPVASVTIPTMIATGDTVSFTGVALLDFLNTAIGSDRLVTFVLEDETRPVRAETPPVFYSRENADGLGPVLVLETASGPETPAIPGPATGLLALSGVALLAARRRRRR